MDKSCIEECPVDCIYEGDRKLYINPRECIDCGACEPACPEDAIFTDFKAPGRDGRSSSRTTARFFARAAAGPGGAARHPGRQREGRPRRRRHGAGPLLGRRVKLNRREDLDATQW